MYFQTAYVSRPDTTTKIAAATTRTKIDSSKADRAGVETGAKIWVGLKGAARSSAAPIN